MGATVIDELIVSLGLDASQFNKGQKEAVDALDKTEKTAGTTSKHMQEEGKKAAGFFSAIKGEVFALTGAFLGLSALKSATTEITRADSALGRLGRTLNLAPTDLKAFEGVAQKYGSSAEDMDSAFQHTADVIAQFRTRGKIDPDFLFNLGQAQIDYAKFFAKETDDIERFKMVADGLNESIESGRRTRAEAMTIGEGMGYSRETVTMMIETKGKLDSLIASYKELNKVTEADTIAAQVRTEAWNTFTGAVENAYRAALNGVTQLMSAEAGVAKEREKGKQGVFASGRTWYGATQVFEQAPSQVSSGGVRRPTPTTSGEMSTQSPAAPKVSGNRNERNNNPGNIEFGPFALKHGAIGSDGRFAIFPSMELGAAAQRALLEVYGRAGVHTVEGVVNKWAPSSENDTAAYVADVTKRSGLSGELNMRDPATLSKLQLAMAAHEGMSKGGISAMSRMLPMGGGSSSTSTSEVHINGPITIQAGNADSRETANLINNGGVARLAMNQSGNSGIR